jgi:ubiquitin-conjugating enzyme E2 J1
METDARGQLGGLETTEQVRMRLAGESGAFKCSTCGRSNAEIIKESEERCSELDAASAHEVQVPSELKMGWRDEMDASRSNAAPVSTETPRQPPADDAETAELAEGFVQTASPPADAPSVVLPPASHPARPAQSVPGPTAVGVPAALPGNVPQPVPALGQVRRESDDGVPLWIDRAIVGLVILLFALLLKILLGM